MIPVLTLVIPFHGIFLSFFFLILGERGTGSNLFLGLMLIILSLLSAFQQLFPQFTGPCSIPSSHFIFYESLICPFLFLYTMTMIRPWYKKRICLHLVIISIILTLILLLNWVHALIYFLFVMFILLINGLYLCSSLILLLGLIRKDSAGNRHIQTSSFSWIITLHVLVWVDLFINQFIHERFAVTAALFTQLPKGLIIYYTYFKILDTAIFGLKQAGMK